MFMSFDEVGQFHTKQLETVSAAAATATKGWQEIASRTTDYAKKSFEKNRLFAEKLAGVTKLDEAVQLQSDFAKAAYEDFVAEATKIGGLYSDLAKQAFKPLDVASASLKADAAKQN
jgi:hypothetical protein